MTITISLDLLVYLYMFLEQYVFTRCVDAWHTAKHIETNEYFTRLKSLEVQDCNQGQEVYSLAPVTEDKELRMSIIDEEAIDLFDSLISELNEVPFDHPLPEYYEPGDNEPAATWDNPYLSMHDIEEQPFKVGMQVPSFVSAKIADNIEGAQQWVVRVIGMEEDYIHVTDGKRIWINIGEQALRVNNGDVLLMDVIKEEKSITVERMFHLEQSPTEDYSIPDESFPSIQQDSVAV